MSENFTVCREEIYYFDDYYGLEIDVSSNKQINQDANPQMHSSGMNAQTNITNHESTQPTSKHKSSGKKATAKKQKVQKIKKTKTINKGQTKPKDRSGSGKGLSQNIYSKIQHQINAQTMKDFKSFLQLHNVKKIKYKHATTQLILIYFYLFLLQTKKKKGQIDYFFEERNDEENADLNILKHLTYFKEEYLQQRLIKANAKDKNNDSQKLKTATQIKIIQELILTQSQGIQLDIQKLQTISSPLFQTTQKTKNPKHFIEIREICKNIRYEASNSEQIIFSVLTIDMTTFE